MASDQGTLSAYQRSNAHAIFVLVLLQGQSDHIENSWIPIRAYDGFFGNRTCFPLPRPFNNTGDANPAFIKPAFRAAGAAART